MIHFQPGEPQYELTAVFPDEKNKLIEPSGKAPVFHQLSKCVIHWKTRRSTKMKKSQLPNENLIRYACTLKQ